MSCCYPGSAAKACQLTAMVKGAERSSLYVPTAFLSELILCVQHGIIATCTQKCCFRTQPDTDGLLIWADFTVLRFL